MADQPKVTVIKFYSKTCNPCRVVKVALDKLKRDLEGQPVEFVDIDAQEDTEAARYHDVQKVPTVLVFQGESETPVARVQGVEVYSKYRRLVEDALKGGR